MSEIKTKTVLVGIDGATFKILNPMMNAGRMPNLAAIAAAGAQGPLRSMQPMLSPSLWTTIVTGRNPGKHGIYDFFREDRTGKGIQFNSSLDRKSPTIWNHASDAGLRVCVTGMIMSYPPDRVNGRMVSAVLGDMKELFPRPGNMNAGCTHPPELAAEILRKIKPLKPSGRRLGIRNRTKHRIGGMLQSVELRLAIHRLLQAGPMTDLDVIYFPETDFAMHFGWDMLNSGGEMAECLFSVFERVDAFLGELRSDPRTNVVIVSDHGFRPLHKMISINNLLAKHGLLVYRTPSPGERIRRVYELLTRLFFHRNRKPLEGFRLDYMLEGIQWERTKAFSFGTTGGTVFLNIKGRSPHGVVDPGEAGDVTKRVKDALLEFRDPETGEAVFSAVHVKEELFHGGQMDHAPDICAVCCEGYGIEHEKDCRFRADRIISPARVWCGDHAEEGVFLAAGPAFVKGAVPEGATVLDVAPTVLAALGIPAPSDMDGRVLAEVMDPQLKKDVERAAAPAVHEPERSGEAGALDIAQQRAIEERLKDLGYM